MRPPNSAMIDVITVLAGALLLLLAAQSVVLLAYWGTLRRIWREPALKYPVLIVESDDWGAGPLQQSAALGDIAAVLHRHADGTGRRPVMCLALVLAVADGDAIRRSGRYRAVRLDEPLLEPVLKSLQAGCASGVFALHLHGMEHYWPEAVMASTDDRVVGWRQTPAPAATEALPAHLQSRWVDTQRLPSREHADSAIDVAAASEVQAFEAILGTAVKVVVPPTFVWTAAVEAAWERAGVECVVTPGARYSRLAADSEPLSDGHRFVNGEQEGGLTYLVRYDYFEPARGRDAAYALRALARASAEGRPCILENHRCNFGEDVAVHRFSLAELDALYSGALRQQAGLRFLSSWELCGILRERHPGWLYLGWRDRLPFLWQRVQHTGRLWKLLRWSGASWLGRAVIGGALPAHAASAAGAAAP